MKLWRLAMEEVTIEEAGSTDTVTEAAGEETGEQTFSAGAGL